MFATLIVKFFLATADFAVVANAGTSAADAHCARTAADADHPSVCLEQAEGIVDDVWDHPARR